MLLTSPETVTSAETVKPEAYQVFTGGSPSTHAAVSPGIEWSKMYSMLRLITGWAAMVKTSVVWSLASVEAAYTPH